MSKRKHKWLPVVVSGFRMRQTATACGLTRYVATVSRWSRVTCTACLEAKR